jgi:hypothetical protein
MNGDGKGELLLALLDVHHNPLNDKVDVFLRHTVLAETSVLHGLDASEVLDIKGLDATQGGIYSVLIFPTRYRAISQFVTINEGAVTNKIFVLPVDPARVLKIVAPDFAGLPDDLQDLLKNSPAVEGQGGKTGADLFVALDDIQKAGLLNIYAKMQHTTFPNKRSVFTYIHALTRVRGDRFFAHVDKDLRDATINSVAANLFHNVAGELHTPPPNFVLTDSFKTFDHYGNLQLTFFSNPATLEFIVDTDIDDAQGIEHIFQVIRNVFTGATNPYDIHEILLEFQNIDPGYQLVV